MQKPWMNLDLKPSEDFSHLSAHCVQGANSKSLVEMDHAELVPVADLEKSPKYVFYLPMHAVRKESSTTTKIRAVF